MAKTILIFADGTGQIGGLRPDQRLSNVYKLYRATRPGPDSPISPKEQVAFYDHGLGVGETKGFTFRRLRNLLASGIGTGIDDNVIDCYAAVIANYEPGDQVCLFGFSRGAYTVRALANVMNLCGVPTTDGQDGAIPRYGPRLRKIASDGVRYVYNHGAGHPREKFEFEREAKASRFRQKYVSEGIGTDGDAQGNVQPRFIGVFDTVAALGSRWTKLIALVGAILLLGATALAWRFMPGWLASLVTLAPVAAAYWTATVLYGQIKYFFPDPVERPSLRKWRQAWSLRPSVHFARWTGKNYDRYVDKEVRYLRHAQAIDEARAKFPRVGWGSSADYQWNLARGNADWLDQVWFAGNHSDIGGSYSEEESRLSDIALQWMVDELHAAIPEVQIRQELLVMSPNPLGLQHDERQALLDPQPAWLRWLTGDRLTWSEKARPVDGTLHATVLTRLAAAAVPQMGEVKPYRPEKLRTHPKAAAFF